MNRILCIFPKDATTEFLRPVYNDICALPNVKGLELDTINDDDFLEVNAVKPLKHRALPEYSLRVMVTEDR